MRCGIFYFSRNQNNQRVPLALPNGGVVFVRVEEVIANDIIDALDRARPQYGEEIMNTHELPEVPRA